MPSRLTEASNGIIYGIGQDSFYSISSNNKFTAKFQSGILQGRLIECKNGLLYGSSSKTIFSINITNTESIYQEILYRIPDFNGESLNDLIEGIDGNLYGTSSGLNLGMIFQFNPLSLEFNIIFNFTINYKDGIAPYGSQPVAGLIVGKDEFLYGCAQSGGLYGYGTIFKISIKSGEFNVIYHFTGKSNIDGGYPINRLIQINNKLYGSTSITNLNDGKFGNLFQLTINGEFTLIYSFTNQSQPLSGFPSELIIGKDNRIYGICSTTGNTGIIFSFNIN